MVIPASLLKNLECERKSFLENVCCDGLYIKSSSLARRPEKCDLQLSHYNWIVGSK
jgi:hypothetical protein